MIYDFNLQEKESCGTKNSNLFLDIILRDEDKISVDKQKDLVIVKQ